MENKNFIDAAELAAYLKCSRTTIYELGRTDPRFPKPLRLGRAVRWRRDQIDAWAAQRIETGAASA